MRSDRIWNAKLPELPVDENGNFMHYPGYRQGGWKPIPVPFHAVMEIDGMFSGRSAKYLVLKDTETGVTGPMFVSDLVKGIQEGTVEIKDARLTAYWTGSKKGQNYGLKPVAL